MSISRAESWKEAGRPFEEAAEVSEPRPVVSLLQRAGGSAEPAKKDVPVERKPPHVESIVVHPGVRAFAYNDPGSLAADRFRLLRMRLRQFAQARKLTRVLITSPLPQDGKSTVALNIATALAEQGKRRVLLIDADLHRSSLNRELGVDLNTGLAECLEAGVNPWSVMRRLDPLAWYLLPAGRAIANPTELLQTQALGELMQKLTAHFDWILIDSPPVIPLTDGVFLTHHTDMTLIVARADSTPQKLIEDAITMVGRQHVAGVILNGVQGLEGAYSKYQGYYRTPQNDRA